MATYGNHASVWLDQYDVSQFFNSASITVSIDTAETSTFQGTYKTFIEGLPGGAISVGGFYDKVNDAYLQTNIMDGGSVMTVIPAGSIPTAPGDLARLAWVHDSNLAESSPVGGAVLVSGSYITDQPVGFGAVLHGIGTNDVNTTTGATYDGLASTTTGWRAHLHVVSISAGSWVVKLQDASASNFSDGADVTGGAFTAATIATSQRLSSASGATLRRYIRYIATRTGGAGGDNITFGLAVSRI